MKAKQLEKTLQRMRMCVKIASNPFYTRAFREDKQIELAKLYEKLGELLP